jgi:hypothetical protein
VAPVPPAPPVLAADASEADKAVAKTDDDVAVYAYDQQVADFSKALSVYRDAQPTYVQWCDQDARDAFVLTGSVLPQFVSELMGLGTVSKTWDHLRQQYHPSGNSLYLSIVRQEHALLQDDSTIDEFYTQEFCYLASA